MTDAEQSSGIDRRTVVKGAAWTVPAVMVSSALPAYATSKTVTTISVVGISGSPTAVTTFRFDTDDNTVVKAGTTARFSVTATPSNPGNNPTPTVSNVTGVTITSDPLLGNWKGTTTWTIDVTLTADQADPLNINFSLGGLPKDTTVVANVVSASTTPASNGLVSFTTNPTPIWTV